MKEAIIAFTISFVLSLLLVYFFSYRIEEGDGNAIGMYFVVFHEPLLVLAVGNGLYLLLLNQLKYKVLVSILSFIPSIVLTILSFRSRMFLGDIDGDLSFAAKVGAIALGITNVVWLLSKLKGKLFKKE